MPTAQPVVIRPYNPADRSACVAVCRSNVPKWIAVHEVDLFERFLDERVPEACRYVVAEAAGELVACGGLAFEAERRRATMCWGLVDRAWHGRRIGWTLLMERMRWLSSEQRREGWVYALQTSQHTYRFFERAGFTTRKLTLNGFGGGLDLYDMTTR